MRFIQIATNILTEYISLNTSIIFLYNFFILFKWKIPSVNCVNSMLLNILPLKREEIPHIKFCIGSNENIIVNLSQSLVPYDKRSIYFIIADSIEVLIVICDMLYRAPEIVFFRLFTTRNNKVWVDFNFTIDSDTFLPFLRGYTSTLNSVLHFYKFIQPLCIERISRFGSKYRVDPCDKLSILTRYIREIPFILCLSKNIRKVNPPPRINYNIRQIINI